MELSSLVSRSYVMNVEIKVNRVHNFQKSRLKSGLLQVVIDLFCIRSVYPDIKHQLPNTFRHNSLPICKRILWIFYLNHTVSLIFTWLSICEQTGSQQLTVCGRLRNVKITITIFFNALKNQYSTGTVHSLLVQAVLSSLHSLSLSISTSLSSSQSLIHKVFFYALRSSIENPHLLH